jgi:hypothetical protein
VQHTLCSTHNAVHTVQPPQLAFAASRCSILPVLPLQLASVASALARNVPSALAQCAPSDLTPSAPSALAQCASSA